MSDERSAAEAGQEIADALHAAGFEYALGGALALAVAGVPRGTIDVDVNVFVSEVEVRPVAEALNTLGVVIDPDVAHAGALRDGVFVGNWDGMRIDVFVPSIPFSWEARKTRVHVVAEDGWEGWFLSAEAVAVFKLLFFRGKDIVDLERLVAVRVELDREYVRKWIVEMMGEDDPRVARWDEIDALHAAGL